MGYGKCPNTMMVVQILALAQGWSHFCGGSSLLPKYFLFLTLLNLGLPYPNVCFACLLEFTNILGSDGIRPGISTSIIGGPDQFDNRFLIEMRTFSQCTQLDQFSNNILPPFKYQSTTLNLNGDSLHVCNPCLLFISIRMNELN